MYLQAYMAFQVTLRKKFSHNGMCPLDVNFPTEVCEARHEREQRKGEKKGGGGERESETDNSAAQANTSHFDNLVMLDVRAFRMFGLGWHLKKVCRERAQTRTPQTRAPVSHCTHHFLQGFERSAACSSAWRIMRRFSSTVMSSVSLRS